MRSFPRHYLCQASLASSRLHNLPSRFNYYRIGFNLQEREREREGGREFSSAASSLGDGPRPAFVKRFNLLAKRGREEERSAGIASRGCAS